MFGCIYPDMCIAYSITSSDRSIGHYLGRTSVSDATRLFSWWVFVGGDTVRRCLASGLSCWARWRARMSSLLKY